MNQHKRLKSRVEKEANQIRKAESDRPNLLAQTIYLGTVGLMIAVPIVAGAYLGRWLDSHLTGFSFSWTISLIVTGVFIGTFNVYFFIRRNE